MREIKFRVWDEKEMLYESNSSLFDRECDGSGIDYQLMQYTGLKDKNGREIYEGDIVKEKGSGNEVIGLVDPFNQLFNTETVALAGYLYYLSKEKIDIEIIGNIYSNPELLHA